MTVNWDGYEPYVPPVIGPLHEMSRKQASEAFKHLMASKNERIENLRGFLGANGIELAGDDTSIQRLNDWFRVSVEPSNEDPERLRNLWYAVVNDISLFLGEVMIERFPGLRWEMFTAGKKNVAYQRHVLIGFTKAAYPKFNVDIDRLVATYGHQIVVGVPVAQDFFLTVIRSAGSRA